MSLFKRKPEAPVNYVVVTPLRAEAGDTLVVQSERRIPREVFLKLKTQLEKNLPGVSILLLESGLKVTGAIAGHEAETPCPCEEAVRKR